MKSMGSCKCVTFNEFISDTLTQENNDKIYAVHPMLMSGTAHPMLMSGTAHLRKRIKLKLVSARGT